MQGDTVIAVRLWLFRGALVLLLIAAILFLIVFPLISVYIYRSTFNVRFQTSPENLFSHAHYEGLSAQNVTFTTLQGHTLSGCRYKSDKYGETKGVVITVHGFGGGGHRGYMPLIHYFASNGYDVFGYDATANDLSEGEVIGGFPQGIIDLDYAIRYVKEAYPGQPIFLVGHSWGAYSVGNVLNFHPDVRGAVMFAGFDKTELMLMQEGEKRAGKAAKLLIPYVRLYERLIYKQYADVSATSGFERAKDARIMVVHSKDDDTVLMKTGYDVLYKNNSENDRVHFVSYNLRGHNNLFYAPAAIIYRIQLQSSYHAFLQDKGSAFPSVSEAKAAFRDDSEYVDFEKCFMLDDELMQKILDMFESAA